MRVEHVTFSPDGHFTLTVTDGDERQTLTGKYSLVLGQLTLQADDPAAKAYSGRKGADGRIGLSPAGGVKQSATILKRTGE